MKMPENDDDRGKKESRRVLEPGTSVSVGGIGDGGISFEDEYTFTDGGGGFAFGDPAVA